MGETQKKRGKKRARKTDITHTYFSVYPNLSKPNRTQVEEKKRSETDRLVRHNLRNRLEHLVAKEVHWTATYRNQEGTEMAG